MRQKKRMRLKYRIKPDTTYVLKYAAEDSPKIMIGYEPPWGSRENPVIGRLPPLGTLWKVVGEE